MFLAWQPCGDISECDNDEQTEISLSAAEHQHHMHLEHCTPFCACSCCATLVVPQPLHSTAHNSLTHEGKVFSAYQNPSLSEVSFNIWQPPQLS